MCSPKCRSDTRAPCAVAASATAWLRFAPKTRPATSAGRARGHVLLRVLDDASRRTPSRGARCSPDTGGRPTAAHTCQTPSARAPPWPRSRFQPGAGQEGRRARRRRRAVRSSRRSGRATTRARLGGLTPDADSTRATRPRRSGEEARAHEHGGGHHAGAADGGLPGRPGVAAGARAGGS
jgi:hypothetical protein